MTVYLGKDRKGVTASMTLTHATVTELTTWTGNVRCNICTNNFYSSTDLFDNVHTKTINCCCTVTPSWKRMCIDYWKKLKTKYSHRKIRVKDHLTATVWRDKKHTYVHKYAVSALTKQFLWWELKYSEARNSTRCTGYADKSDSMINNHLFSRQT